jgi:hypothetical protein
VEVSLNCDDFNLSDRGELFFSIYRPAKQHLKILRASEPAKHQILFDLLFAGRSQLFANSAAWSIG